MIVEINEIRINIKNIAFYQQIFESYSMSPPTSYLRVLIGSEELRIKDSKDRVTDMVSMLDHLFNEKEHPLSFIKFNEYQYEKYGAN